MNNEQLDFYHAGYFDCYCVVESRLRKILERKSGYRAAIESLIAKFKAELDAAHWRSIQREFPGITWEEYEAECDASFETIRSTFYSEKGYLKPRLVRTAQTKIVQDEEL